MKIPHPFREVENAWRTDLHNSYLLITNFTGEGPPEGEDDEIVRIAQYDRDGVLMRPFDHTSFEHLVMWVLVTKRPFGYPLHPGMMDN